MKLGVNPYNFTSIIRELFVTNNPTRSNSWKTLALVDFFLPFFFFLICKEKDILKRGAKRATQSIQYLYIHHQNGQKRKKKIPNRRG